ncbi:keratin-associated protein 9-1-like [Anopheles funestus]|uniref:keratin-associated protein 9-1-like n=1 Tax=Anopheles funestus TaxID=62324 RepID=UPI0020C73318|nr:keratin-associated protein 9-1-like [Anopheles funestus]
MKVTTVCLAIVALVGSAAAVSYPYQNCPKNEVMVASPPCCEPTCDCDCEQSCCQQLLVYQPTCVCMTGYVRLDGQCVPKSYCPVKEPEPDCYTTPAHQPSCGCGYTPCQCTQPSYQPAPVYHTEPVYETCETTCAPETTTCSYHPAPVYEQPSCGCGYNPCQCSQLSYRPAPVYHPEPVYHTYETTCAPETTTCSYHPAPVYEKPSCGCGQTPCKCVQPAYHPAPVYHTEPAYETTKAPTCAPCEQLVFTHPCCEPTCDNDCSGTGNLLTKVTGLQKIIPKVPSAEGEVDKRISLART